MQQWKVVSGTYRRVFHKFMGAKRDYGMWCKVIDADQEGLVQLFQRENINEDWILLEEFGWDEEE